MAGEEVQVGMMSEGVPPRQFMFFVGENETVGVPRKLGVAASSLRELEQAVAAELGLAEAEGGYVIYLLDKATGEHSHVTTLEGLPAKAKIQVRPRPASVGMDPEEAAECAPLAVCRWPFLCCL